MPPKGKQNQQKRASQQGRAQVVPIEEHISRDDLTNDVPQILKKLEVAYKQDKETLSISLFHMILRLCGLSDIIPSLDELTQNQSLEAVLQEIAENKINRRGFGLKAPLIISPKDRFYDQFMNRFSLFFKKLLSEDFEFMKESKKTHFLQKMRTWLGILSKSKLRNIRFAAVEVMKLLIDSQVKLYTFYMVGMESRIAYEFAKDVEIYLKTSLKDRLKDIDSKVRETIFDLLKLVLLGMDSDVVSKESFQQIFLPLLKESNPKVVEPVLLLVNLLINKSKKIKGLVAGFVIAAYAQFEKLSLIPNRNGSLCLSILMEVNKLYPEEDVLNPKLISNVFHFYSIENYTYGLATAIEAFYSSIFTDFSKLEEKKSMVLIEIVNLMNNYQSKSVRENILNQFFNYSAVNCCTIFDFDELFQVIIVGEYNYEGEQVMLSDQELLGWLDVACCFAKFVKKSIEKYQAFEDKKYDELLSKFKSIGNSFNNNLLSNIKEIYHNKIEGKTSFLTKNYLELIGLLFLPISTSYEHYAQYLIEKMVALFQSQTDSTILKGIVEIFFNIKIYDISALTKHISEPNRMAAETVVLKKLSILSKYFVSSYVNRDFVEQILHNFKKASHQWIKIEYIIGLFLVHQWYLNTVLDNNLSEQAFFRYKTIQKDVITFLLGLVSSLQCNEVKFSAANILCMLMTVVCNDEISDVGSIYYQVSEGDMMTIYRFLGHEYGLPKLQQKTEEQKDLEMTRFFNNYDALTFNYQKSLKMLFSLYANSLKIASFSNSLEIILSSLMEEEQSFDPDQTVLKLSKSFSDTKQSYYTVCARQKLASRYLQKLIDKEIETENANRFIFWKLASVVLQFKASQSIKQKVVLKLIDLYLKKKLSKDQQKVSLNKALLFVMSEFDRVRETSSFEELFFLQLILKKISRKITKQALKRVFMFFKSKYEQAMNISEEAKKEITSMISLMEKICKEDKNKSMEEEPEENEEAEEKENNANYSIEIDERAMMRPIQKGPQTRSRSKRESN